MTPSPDRRATVRSVTAVAVSLAALSGRVSAHGGALSQAAGDSLAVPTWLVVATGGAAVGASFLLAGFVTDRALIASIHGWGGPIPIPGRRTLLLLARALGVVGLCGVLAVGLFGPLDPLSNAAILVVWAGWWAGYAMSTYLLGNSWPALNPWRTLAAPLARLGRTYEWRWGAWPSVAGLLALIWLEVVSPLADDPRLLAVVVIAYTVVSVAGGAVYGPDTWFRSVDPVARVFRLYGAVAPLTTEGESLTLRLPGSALAADRLDGLDEVAFVVALLWVTTYDGFVTTPAWNRIATTLSPAVPLAALYPAALLAGFALFLCIYLLAARLARRTGDTYLSAGSLARRFAPPLLAIAAGYHVAHFLGYFLSLSPTLIATVTAPFGTVEATALVVPGWFGGVAIAGVLLGHLLAIWAAHAAALSVFPGRLQAIRSQYPFIAAMVCYTMVSLWVVTRPDVTPPFP